MPMINRKDQNKLLHSIYINSVTQHDCLSCLWSVNYLMYLHPLLRHKGDLPPKWVSFCKKSLNMGPIFHEKISNYGSDLQKFWGFRIENSQEFWKFGVLLWQEMVTFFSDKIPKYGYLRVFLEKITPGHGYGFWAAGGTSPINQNLSTPLPPLCTGIVSHGAQFEAIQVFCQPRVQKQMQTKLWCDQAKWAEVEKYQILFFGICFCILCKL